MSALKALMIIAVGLLAAFGLDRAFAERYGYEQREAMHVQALQTKDAASDMILTIEGVKRGDEPIIGKLENQISYIAQERIKFEASKATIENAKLRQGSMVDNNAIMDFDRKKQTYLNRYAMLIAYCKHLEMRYQGARQLEADFMIKGTLEPQAINNYAASLEGASDALQVDANATNYFRKLIKSFDASAERARLSALGLQTGQLRIADPPGYMRLVRNSYVQDSNTNETYIGNIFAEIK